MKYLLLDTNIYINLVINRDKNKVDTRPLESFIKLIHNSDNVKLLVPEIIRYEVYKNIGKSVDLISQNIDKLIKDIQNLYLVTETEHVANLEKNKNESLKSLTTLKSIYDTNANIFKVNIEERFNEIFSSINTISIDTSNNLLAALMKRKVFQKAPLHNQSKKADADALIIETLINLKKFLTINSDDIIYFITENYTDFAVGLTNKTTFHSHIESDLKSTDMFKHTRLSDNFQRCIFSDLKDEVDSIGLAKEFDKAYIDLEEEFEDMQRKLAGLSSLSSFHGYLYSINSHSKEMREINTILSKIYNIVQMLCTYYDNFISQPDSNKIQNTLHDNSYFIFCILKLKYNMYKNQNNIRYMAYFDYKEDTEFPILSKGIIKILWSQTDINPISGGNDEVSINLCDDTNNILVSSKIEFSYGHVDFNEDGNIQDAMQDEINVDLTDIVNTLQKYLNEYEDFIKKYIQVLGDI